MDNVRILDFGARQIIGRWMGRQIGILENPCIMSYIQDGQGRTQIGLNQLGPSKMEECNPMFVMEPDQGLIDLYVKVTTGLSLVTKMPTGLRN